MLIGTNAIFFYRHTRQPWTGLIEDIRERGILEPITVIDLTDNVFLVLSGALRLRAAIYLDMPNIPARVRPRDEIMRIRAWLDHSTGSR